MGGSLNRNHVILTSFLLFLVVATLASKLVVVTLLPNEIIVPAILVISLLGSFAINFSMADVLISLLFAILTYFPSDDNLDIWLEGQKIFPCAVLFD